MKHTRTFAQQISDAIRSADSAGYNVYWDRGEHQPTLRVIKARTRTEKSMLPRTFTQVYCLPCGEWIEIPDVCGHQLDRR